MSVALTRRAKTALRFGELDLPFETAVQQLCGALKASGAQIGFLLDLAETDMGRPRGVFLFGSLSRIFSHLRSARDLAPAQLPGADRRHPPRTRRPPPPRRHPPRPRRSAHVQDCIPSGGSTTCFAALTVPKELSMLDLTAAMPHFGHEDQVCHCR